MSKKLFKTTKEDKVLLKQLYDAEKDDLKNAVEHYKEDAFLQGCAAGGVIVISGAILHYAATVISQKIDNAVVKSISELWDKES